MPNYCVNRQPQPGSGDHEVHDLGTTKGCLPDWANRLELGFHASCSDAVAMAGHYYSDVDGCYYCANSCHMT